MSTSTPEDSDAHPSGGRWLLVAVGVLVAVATAALVLTNDLRWLRMGVLAALWAALIGAFIAARYRKRAAEAEEDAADRQQVYELELEREVTARREYELEVQAKVRRKVEAQSRADLESLHAELRTLRESLESLLRGDILVERVALRAESTRMRSLGEDARPLPGRPAPVRRIAAGSDDVTELIERVIEAERREQPRRPSQQRRREQPAEPAENWHRPDPPAKRRQPAPEPERLAERIDPAWTPSWESSSAAPEPAAAEQRARPRQLATPPRSAPSPSTPPSSTPQPSSAPARRRTAAQPKPAPEPTPPPAPEPAPTGRRHRRDDTGSWQELAAWQPTPEPEPEPEPVAGSHVSGTSVEELLAAYGADQRPGRRRRRD